jgi:hypothetical protein
MTKVVINRRSIPKSLLEAKNAAASEFLSMEIEEHFLPFVARADPKYNVVGVGVGRKIVSGRPIAQHSVRFYVEKKIPKYAIPEEHLLPRRVRGVLTDVIEAGRFYALAGPASEQARVRPARPGCSIGFAFTGRSAGNVMAGTFGAVVKADNKTFILSNNHVLANQNNLPMGSPIYQPGLLDKDTPTSDAIAKLSKFIRLVKSRPNQVDCAIAEVRDHGLVSPIVMSKVGKLKSGLPVAAALSMKVEKTGRTTGYTSGAIQDISANVKVRYNVGPLIFSDQIIVVGEVSSFSNPGDSGSLIVERSTKRPVGLLFGGSTGYSIANHIEDVLELLKVIIVA